MIQLHMCIIYLFGGIGMIAACDVVIAELDDLERFISGLR